MPNSRGFVDVTVRCADDAHGDGVGKPQWASDGNRPITEFNGVGISQCRGRKRRRIPDQTKDGDIKHIVAAEDGSFPRVAVDIRDFDAICIGHDVLVRDHEFLVLKKNDESRSYGVRSAFLGFVILRPSEEAFEERVIQHLGERIIDGDRTAHVDTDDGGPYGGNRGLDRRLPRIRNRSLNVRAWGR